MSFCVFAYKTFLKLLYKLSDGLDTSKQQFKGSINIFESTYSQGATKYDNITVNLDPEFDYTSSGNYRLNIITVLPHKFIIISDKKHK